MQTDFCECSPKQTSLSVLQHTFLPFLVGSIIRILPRGESGNINSAESTRLVHLVVLLSLRRFRCACVLLFRVFLT
jgi:hypothetical protein